MSPGMNGGMKGQQPGGIDPAMLAAMMGGQQQGGMPPQGASPFGALGALNATQPPPPMGGDDGGLMGMLGGGMDSPLDFSPLGADPSIYGMQAGQGNPDPFASMPFDGGQGGGQLLDQLEGMGLGAQPPMPPQGGMQMPPGMQGMQGMQPTGFGGPAPAPGGGGY